MRRSGVVTKIRLFYAIVMTYDFKDTRILRRKGMKINDNVVFDRKDVIKFRAFTVLSVLLCIFVNSGLIFGFLNYDNEVEKSEEAYFYMDKTESYEFCVDEEMSVDKTYEYNENKYEKSKQFENLKISKVLEEMILNDENEEVIAVTYVQKDESNKEQLKQINDEIDYMKEWVKQNFDEEIKFVVTKGFYEDLKYAKSKSLPVGKYIVYKNNLHVDKSLEEDDLDSVPIADLFDFNDSNKSKYIFEDNIKHIEDTSEDIVVSESASEEVSETPTKTPVPTHTEDKETKESNIKDENTKSDDQEDAKKESLPTKSSTPTSTPNDVTPEPVIENLALNKDVSASAYILGYEPDKSVDSSYKSSWSVNPTGNDWLRIDLGKEKNITSIEITWSDINYSENVGLFMYDDEYKKVDDYECFGGLQKLSFSEFKSRYIHLSFGKNVDKYLLISDIKIYGY